MTSGASSSELPVYAVVCGLALALTGLAAECPVVRGADFKSMFGAWDKAHESLKGTGNLHDAAGFMKLTFTEGK